jgi:hypothetical protein
MKIEITTDRQPFVDGARKNKGDVIEVTAADGKAMIANGFAKEVKAEPKRARDAKGKLKADDPSTPDVNEAWEGGKAPKKRGRPKKNV